MRVTILHTPTYAQRPPFINNGHFYVSIKNFLIFIIIIMFRGVKIQYTINLMLFWKFSFWYKIHYNTKYVTYRFSETSNTSGLTFEVHTFSAYLPTEWVNQWFTWLKKNEKKRSKKNSLTLFSSENRQTSQKQLIRIYLTVQSLSWNV